MMSYIDITVDIREEAQFSVGGLSDHACLFCLKPGRCVWYRPSHM